LSLPQFIATEEETTCDKICFDSMESDINLTVPWFLMAAYAYHVDHDPIISDSQYDRMVKRMLDHWAEIEHKHKELISIKDHHVETYPLMIKTAVKDMRRNMVKKRFTN